MPTNRKYPTVCKCGNEIKAKSYECKSCVNERVKKWAAKNPDRSAANCKKWASANREHLNKYRREYYSKNPGQKRAHLFYTTLRKVIVGISSGRYFVKQVGLETKNQLMGHLISTIPDGYTIVDYGSKLQIDHIVPCCSFDLTQKDQCDKCFHYTNLRLVLKQDNLNKAPIDRRKSIYT